MPVLWSQNCSEDFHQGGVGSGGSHAQARNRNVPIPRRLVHPNRQVLQDQLRQLLSLIHSAFSSTGRNRISARASVLYTWGSNSTFRWGVWPSQERLGRLHEALVDLHALGAGLIALWLHLVSIMALCIDIVPRVRLHMQLFVLSQWKTSSRDLSIKLTVTTPLAKHLRWWWDRKNLTGVQLRKPQAQLMLKMDVCTSCGGWFIVNKPFAQV